MYSNPTSVPSRRRAVRVGLLVPSSNTVMEVDLYRNLPSEVTVHTARMYMEETTPEGEAWMLDEFTMPAARDIATVRPDVVVFGCTSAGALRGNAFDTELCAQISQVTKAPTISVIASVRDSLALIGARTVAVITPYVDALNERIRVSLEADGLEVVALHGLGITDNFQIAEVGPERITSFAMERAGTATKDCVFLSCTNLRALDALPLLGRALGVPVVTSNQAVLEAIAGHLRATGKGYLGTEA